MKQYLDLLKDILENGNEREDRTGIGTISVFGRQIRFNMKDGFPAVTTKKLAWKSVVSELLWFLEGSTNEHRLAEIRNEKPYNELSEKERKTIWTLNAENQGVALGYKDGELGPVYGKQWCKWKKIIIEPMRDFFASFCGNTFRSVEINQIENIIKEIKENPTSRRLLVSAWNVAELDEMALPPCHYSFQFYVDGDKLSLMWNQRSVDSTCGLPFNIASYGLLLHIIAKLTNKIPHELIGNLGDCHIYKNHIDSVREQIKRTPHKLPTLKLPEVHCADLNSYLEQVKTSDFILENYEHEPKIVYPMAI
jgi:thymidylate synthase